MNVDWSAQDHSIRMSQIAAVVSNDNLMPKIAPNARMIELLIVESVRAENIDTDSPEKLCVFESFLKSFEMDQFSIRQLHLRSRLALSRPS